MFEEKNIQNQPPQNLPTQIDRDEEEKKLFGETEGTSLSEQAKPTPTIPKEFLAKKKKFPLLLILVIIILIIIIVAFAQSIFKFIQEKIEQIAPSTAPVNQSAQQIQAPTSPAANQLVDSDSDGLTDEEEASIGTNPQSTDSDNDGLFDFEEIKVYKTDPLNSDTDGDGYLDGEEVRAGYNPKDSNPGAKLLDLMQEIEKEKIQ